MTDGDAAAEGSTAKAEPGARERVVELSGICKSFGAHAVLHGVDLTIHAGEHVVVVFGPSGSGKSTLLRTVNLLEEPTEGSVRVLGAEYGPAAQFNKSNGNKLKEVSFPRPLQVQYGAWAVQKGNTALVRYLNGFLCKVQSSGELAKWYKATEGAPLPPMRACK